MDMINKHGRSLPEEEKSLGRNLLSALDPFFDLSGTLPTRCIQAFLLVAIDPGLPVTEYARRANMSMSTMSRNLLDIGERNRHMEEGFGLVEGQSNPMNLREKEYFLTTKGLALFHRVVRPLKG